MDKSGTYIDGEIDGGVSDYLTNLFDNPIRSFARTNIRESDR